MKSRVCGNTACHNIIRISKNHGEGHRRFCEDNSCKNDRARRRSQIWKENNPEKYKERQEKWYKNNTKKVKKRSKEWRGINTERARQIDRKSRKNNSEDYKKYNQRRRTRKLNAYVEDVDRNLLRIIYDDTCYLCGDVASVDNPGSSEYINIEHIIPLVSGGTHSYSNISLAHSKCNGIKGSRPLDELVEQNIFPNAIKNLEYLRENSPISWSDPENDDRLSEYD